MADHTGCREKYVAGGAHYATCAWVWRECLHLNLFPEDSGAGDLRLFDSGVYSSLNVPVNCLWPGRGTSVVNTDINLASKPFNNRLLPWLMTVVLLFISIIGLLIVVRFNFVANQQARAIQADIDKLKEQEKGILGDANKVKESLTPEQFQALQGAHQLVDRKRFSWSRLLADLESSLPGNVRVSRIAVRDVTAQSEQTVAELDLVVFAKSSTSITEMIADMDKVGIFQAELRAQNLQKGRGESGTEYELFVVYRPRAGVATERIAEIKNQPNVNEGSK